MENLPIPICLHACRYGIHLQPGQQAECKEGARQEDMSASRRGCPPVALNIMGNIRKPTERMCIGKKAMSQKMRMESRERFQGSRVAKGTGSLEREEAGTKEEGNSRNR